MITALLERKNIQVDVNARDWQEAIKLSAQPLVKSGDIKPCYIDGMIDVAKKLGPYIAIAAGIAIAHARPEAGVINTSISLAKLRTPVAFGHPVNDPISLVFILAAKDDTEHVQALSELALILSEPSMLDALFNAMSADEIFECFKKAEESIAGNTVTKAPIQHLRVRKAKDVKTLDEAKAYALEMLMKAGAPENTAAIVADSLAWADARGTTSHGLNMLDAYLDRIEVGGIDPAAVPTTLSDSTTHVIMDARNGFGQVAMVGLLEALEEKAATQPVVCGSIRKLNHCGALAYYTERAANDGFIAMLFVNANPTVAPFGGIEAVLGTNPLSVAAPTVGKPIVLDMASSAVAKAKIYRAAKLGQGIDPSWALDAEGNPTEDAEAAIKGVLLPMAGPKGYGIALIIEILAGVLSGAGITNEVSSVHHGLERGMNAGAFLILIRPDAFMPIDKYSERMNQLITRVKGARTRPNEHIFLPGEIEQDKFTRSREEGIEYSEKIFKRS